MLLVAAALLQTSFAQVVINEVSSVQSDRLLQHRPGLPPKLGAMPGWQELEFIVPGWWQSGGGPVGFGYSQVTNVQPAVQNKTPVLYLRREFTLSAAQAASTLPLELLLDYDDGFVAYVNGREVARANSGAPGSHVWHEQPAFHSHGGGTAETFSLGQGNTVLRAGTNVLAIQILNNSIGDGDLRCAATLRLGGAVPQNLVVPGDAWHYFAGIHEPSGGLFDGADFGAQYPLGPNWTQPSYSDAAWSQGPGGFGFDSAPDYGPQIGTNLGGQMQNNAYSVYLRRSFNLTQAQYEGLTATTLTVDFDDGYVLYLNGYELSRGSMAGAAGTFVAYNAAANGHGASRDNGGNDPSVIATVTVPKNLLRPGLNVLSAQLHNSSLGSSDLLLDVRFSGTSNGTPLTFATLGSLWQYRVNTSEIGIPAPDNDSVVEPEFVDWIELKNTSPAEVDLSGWHLTDSNSQPQKWTFPAGTAIPAGGFLVVACTGRDITEPSPGGLLHTNFSLSSNGEYVALRDAGGVLRSELSGVPDQNAFHTWARESASGEYRFSSHGTPGAENVVGTAFGVVSEVNFDKQTGFYASTPSVGLSTNTPGATIRYTLDGTEPTETNGTVYAGPFDPTNPPTSEGPGSGQILREMFQWPNGTVVKPANLSPSATPTSSMLLNSLESPTNTGDYYTQRVRGYLHVPVSGVYTFWIATDDDGELWLSTTDSPANKQRIAYIENNWAPSRDWTKFTTQQSAPRSLVAGQRYYIEALQSEGAGGDNLAVGWSGPGLPGGINVIEGRYLSPPEVLPPGTTMPPGYGVVRARAFAPGLLPSEVRTRNYVVGANPLFSTAPAIFLSGPPAETFYAPNGVLSAVGGNWSGGSWQPNNIATDYNFALVRGESYERPAVFEVIAPGNQVVERTNVGTRFAGSPWSRPQYRLDQVNNGAWNTSWVTKPQFNLFFRGDYGISKLTVPDFIPGSTLREWDQLRLRAGKNDAYDPFIIDEFMRRSLHATGAPAPLGFFASLFINGEFKSYFNPTERPREPFYQEFYNTDSEWDVHYNNEWENGDGVAFGPMWSFFRNNDFTSLANYQQGAAYWDMVNVADYFIVNTWAATQDWPHNNFTFARERAPGAKWRFSMWDAEGGLGTFGQSNTHNSFESNLLVPENGSRNPAISSDGTVTRLIFRRACQNAEFRLLFADRLQRHFYNEGAMTRPKLQERWTSLKAQADPLIRAVFNRDGTNNHWNNWSNRDSLFLSQCRSAGLWPNTAAPILDPFGGAVPAGSNATMSNPNGSGTVYYTTSGVDPRAVGGGIQGTAYAGPIPINTPFTLKARIRSTTGEWSPLIETNFAPPSSRIVISEINYNPPGPDELTEFVELLNVGGSAVSLNGAQFTEGITYTFGAITLAPGETAVLVKDSAAFGAAYPGVPIAGVFSGSLSNEGETLTLVDITGAIITTFTYGDSNVTGWPGDPDGEGDTLVLQRPFDADTDPTIAGNWRSSRIPGGQPGSPDSTTFAGDPTIDEDEDGSPALVEYALGLSDTDPAECPHFELSRDGAGRLIVSFIHPVAADDVIIEGLQSSNLTFWNHATGIGNAPAQSGWIRSTWMTTVSQAGSYFRLRVTKP